MGTTKEGYSEQILEEGLPKQQLYGYFFLHPWRYGESAGIQPRRKRVRTPVAVLVSLSE